MLELPVSELTGGDVGNRVIVARDGNTFEGTLTNLDVTRGGWNLPTMTKITTSLTVKTLTPGVGTSSDKVLSELRLTDLPMDYLIQVERGLDSREREQT